MTLAQTIAQIETLPSWSYRLEGGHQRPQFTVFNGKTHHCRIARASESLDELAQRVFAEAAKSLQSRAEAG